MPITNMLHGRYIGTAVPALFNQTGLIMGLRGQPRWHLGPTVEVQIDEMHNPYSHGWHRVPMADWQLSAIYRVGTPEHASWLGDHGRWVAFIAAEAYQPVEA